MNALIQKPVILACNAVLPFLLKVNEKIKNILTEASFYIIAFLLLFSQVAGGLNLEHSNQQDRNKIIIFLIFFVAILSIKNRAGVINYRLPIVITWFLFCLTATIIVLIHYKNFGYMTLLFLWFVFPFFCFVWNNRKDYDTLYKMICRPFAHLYIAYSIFVLYLILFAPDRYNIYISDTVGNRLCAATVHPNYFGVLILAGCTCCLYLMLVTKNIAARIFYSTGVCFSGIYLIMASSRTSTLCLVASIMLVIIYALRQKDRRTTINAVVLLAVFVLSSCFAVVVPINQLGVKNQTAADNTPVENAENIAPTETPDASDERISGIIDRYNPFGKKLYALTSGRPDIWRLHIKHLNLTGENLEERNAAIQQELSWTLIHAHNQYLQTAHTMGIFTGVFELLRDLTALGYMFVTVLKKDKMRLYNAFSMMVMCSYFLISMMEYIGEPTRRGISLLFLFAFIPLLPSLKNSAEDETSISSEND